MKRILLVLAGALVLALVLFLVRRHRAAPTAPPSTESRPEITTGTAPPPSTPRPASPAKTPETPPVAAVNDAGFGGGEVALKGAWGSAPGQFGKRVEPESNPEAPMSFVAGRAGELTVVDQVNRRVQRWQDGKLVSTVTLGGDTVQDVAVGEGGRTLVLDRLADKNVQVYGEGGKLQNEVTLEGKGVPEGGGVTGLFSDDKGIYVEREHGPLVKIADANGKTTPEREELPGRPTRDGQQLVSAALGNRSTGEVLVRGFDRSTGQPRWEGVASLGRPIFHVLMLDSDRSGMIYVAALTGRESETPPFRIIDEAIVVARLGPSGQPRGVLALPAYPTPEESFRPMTVDDAGNVYLMVVGKEGMTVLRFAFP